MAAVTPRDAASEAHINAFVQAVAEAVHRRRAAAGAPTSARSLGRALRVVVEVCAVAAAAAALCHAFVAVGEAAAAARADGGGVPAPGYDTAAYWLAQTISTVGYGDVTPPAGGEWLFVVAALGGIALFSRWTALLVTYVESAAALLRLPVRGRSAVCMYLALVVAAACHQLQALEGWSTGRALYFLAVTATTVGYGDVLPEQPQARLVAVAYILAAVGPAGYVLGAFDLFAPKDSDGVSSDADEALVATVREFSTALYVDTAMKLPHLSPAAASRTAVAAHCASASLTALLADPTSLLPVRSVRAERAGASGPPAASVAVAKLLAGVSH